VYKEKVHTDRAPCPAIHEPQAIKAGPFVFLSQLLATDYEHGVAPAARVDPEFPYASSGIKRQLTYIFENADAILQAAGSSIKHLVRRQAYLSTFPNVFPAAREVTVATFTPDPPPSTTVSVGRDLLVPGCVFQLDAIGVER
jgi:enamine deaminase RidA (YjgF/YER057c/UK114 family)